MRRLTLLLLLLAASAAAQTPQKVACVGNSITYGAGIENREQNSYPRQLQYLLGDGYEVYNFGHNARTLLLRGDLPYVQGEMYAQSIDCKPDVVVIKLGTNDLKPQNAVYLEADYYNDYKALIASYREVNPAVRVILCKPVKCYLPDSVFSTPALERIVIPAVERLAYELDCEIVDLYAVFDTEWDESLLPDRLHPSSIGAGRVAKRIADAILNQGCETTNITSGESFNFHGYKGTDFKYRSTSCKLVLPNHHAPGNPWVLRARFWGHEPQLDMALLERGFAVAYCDVADLYGAPAAVERWNGFYDYMTGQGFSPKVVLEGMSRGGLIVYNWAAQNPEKVAAIYADAPVMDFMSWPVGVSEEDTQKMLRAYGFKHLKQAAAWRRQPVDQAARLVGIPIIHVVGDADEVVPVAENTALFEQRLRAAGGEMTVIHKPGVGHHPHSLAAPQPLADFILRACGLWQNPCIVPVPGNEYRALSAGWTAGTDWHAQAGELSQLLQTSADIVLLGNSITQGLCGERKLVAGGAARQIADSLFAPRRWVAAGISGDRTQHQLWRLRNGGYAAAKPANVFITIGINNLTGGDDAPDVAQGIGAVAREAAKQFPDARIVLFGVLPAGQHPADALRVKCREVHRLLSGMEFGKVVYIDPAPWFTTADGELRTELYNSDCLHLSPAGYRVWCGQMAQLLEK